MTDDLLDQMAQQSYRKHFGDDYDEAKGRGDDKNFLEALKSFAIDVGAFTVADGREMIEEAERR